jgi:hypothetical protein
VEICSVGLYTGNVWVAGVTRSEQGKGNLGASVSAQLVTEP